MKRIDEMLDGEIGINDIEEIGYLKMVAIAAEENMITLWNFIGRPHYLFKITTDHTRLHTVKFFNTH